MLEELAHLQLDVLVWVSTTSMSLQHVSSTVTLTSGSLNCSKSSPSWNLTLWGGSLQLSESTARLKTNVTVTSTSLRCSNSSPSWNLTLWVGLYDLSESTARLKHRYLNIRVVELLEELVQLELYGGVGHGRSHQVEADCEGAAIRGLAVLGPGPVLLLQSFQHGVVDEV